MANLTSRESYISCARRGRINTTKPFLCKREERKTSLSHTLPRMTLQSNGHSRVPPGFRFHPTDEELVNYYLRKKVAMEKFELDVIRDVDLNKLEPWDLHERCKIDSTPQTEWYFFSHKDKKYPTGTRTNRATAAGFWKATGRDKAVHSNFKRIGMRKTLVFYQGRAPHGQKTDWIMHEYRLEDIELSSLGNEDGWVVCRVFKKRSHHQKGHEDNFVEDDQVGFLEKLESCKKFYEESTPTQPLICKQEFGVQDHGFHQDPFLQLPPLESPKMNCNNPASSPFSDVKMALTENCRSLDFPHPFSLDVTATDATTKSLFMSEDGFSEYAHGGHLTEWGMLESCISKEIRYNPEISNFSVDIQFPSHRQQPLEYPAPSCEVELWSFTR